jgi:hypothetical protein
VESLPDQDCLQRTVVCGDLLGRPSTDGDLWHPPAQFCSHPGVRFDGEH